MSVSGGTTYALNKGQVATFTINTSCEITSNFPVSVAQLATSEGCNYPDPQGPGIPTSTVVGDPGIINLVPSELHQKKTIFYTEGVPMSGAFADHLRLAKHRVNIVIKTAAIGNLKLDNTVLPANSFTPVSASSGYSYTRLTLDTLTLKQHVLTCDSGFNALIYAFASFNFYGHHLGYDNPEIPIPAGLRKKEIDTHMSIFPIPASETLNVRSYKHIRSIQIIDLFGKVVFTQQPPSGTMVISLDLKNLPEGVYHCCVSYHDENTASEVRKFIKTGRD